MHYIIKIDEWNKKISDINLSNTFKFFEENSLRKLGISVIWVNDYEEIPSILHKIKSGN